MSLGNWRSYLAAGGLLILAVVAEGIPWIAYAQRADPTIRENTATQAAQDAEDSGEAPEASPSKQQPAYAADYQRACSKPQDATEADLCQQWRSARAAEEIVNLTRQQVELASREFYALIGTLLFTAIAAVAAALAARSADRSISVTREMAQRELRAYVTAEADHVENLRPNGIPVVSLLFTNSGPTPARVLTSDTKILIDVFPPDRALPPVSKINRRFPDIYSKSDIGPHKSLFTSVAPPFCLLENAWQEMIAGNLALYVYGKCEYEDVFGEERITEYSFFITGPFLVDAMRKAGPLALDQLDNSAFRILGQPRST